VLRCGFEYLVSLFRACWHLLFEVAVVMATVVSRTRRTVLAEPHEISPVAEQSQFVAVLVFFCRDMLFSTWLLSSSVSICLFQPGCCLLVCD